MSQSDYINHKKQATILRRQDENLDNILSSQSYSKFKSFSVANEIKSDNLTYGQLPLSTKERVFDIEIPVSSCASFKTCINDYATDRPNRVLTMTDHMGKRGYTRMNGYNEYFVKQKANNLIMPCTMFEKCDNFLYLRGSGGT